MSLLREMLLDSSSVDTSKNSMALESFLGELEYSAAAELQPVSPDVLAQGSEDLHFTGSALQTLPPQSGPEKFDSLFPDLEPLDSSALLSDLLDDQINIEDFFTVMDDLEQPVGEMKPVSSSLVEAGGGLDIDTIMESIDGSSAAGSGGTSAALPAVQCVDASPSSVCSVASSQDTSPASVVYETVHLAANVEIAEDVGSPEQASYTAPQPEPTALDSSQVCASGFSEVRFQPYKRSKTKAERTESKKERKRLQNQQAAIRYRQKKKKESDILAKEASILRSENLTLENKVEGLEKEISYMKDLLLEVYKVKGLTGAARKLKVS